jgi:hypothetical protein
VQCLQTSELISQRKSVTAGAAASAPPKIGTSRLLAAVRTRGQPGVVTEPLEPDHALPAPATAPASAGT